MPARRRVLRNLGCSLGLALPVLSGCLGTASDPAGSNSTGSSTRDSTGDPRTTTEPNSDCPTEYPEPPTNPTAGTARGFAETYEYAVAYNDGCQYETFSAYGVTADDASTVITATNTAFFVAVRESYSYSGDEVEGDGVTEGLYQVSDGTFTRVDSNAMQQVTVGERLGRDYPRDHSLDVVNFGQAQVEVTVSITDRETDWQASETWQLRAGTGATFRFALDEHVHDVTVEFDDSTVEYALDTSSSSEQAAYVFGNDDGTISGRWDRL
ncbi:hypothetical protein [Haloarchaeobius sp. DFWS5]|uniref:hypothetical protein n=1 Tax=Haloarchaeobius sp. DFWS5 TaxID=3446114 RepID=UPI003EB7339B